MICLIPDQDNKITPILSARRRIDPVLNTQHATKCDRLWIDIARCCNIVKTCIDFVVQELTLLRLPSAFTSRSWGGLSEYLTFVDSERRFDTASCRFANNVLLNPFQFCCNPCSSRVLIWIGCLLASRGEILMESSGDSQPFWVIGQKWTRLLRGCSGGMWDLDINDLGGCVSHRGLDDHIKIPLKRLYAGGTCLEL